MLVVVWATVAVLGGAIYAAKHVDPPDGGTAAGLGLCAVSVAMFVRRTVRKVPLPPLMACLGPRVVIPRPQGLHARATNPGPPSTGPPIFILLQVSRT